jgi:RNase H-like domain found in reverse transcriptase
MEKHSWNFDESCKLAFLTLKQAFISAPVLTHYKLGCPLVIETDAFNYALAAILSQVKSNRERIQQRNPSGHLFILDFLGHRAQL